MEFRGSGEEGDKNGPDKQPHIIHFPELPVEIQLEIFRKLKKKTDLRNARLVCSDWMLHINHILYPCGFISNETQLELIKKSYFKCIRLLIITTMVEPLPIYSTTRSELPHSDMLFLCKGISLENILKVLRYYTKYAKQLYLFGCFETVLKHTFGGFNLDNIHVLEFDTLVLTAQRSELAIEIGMSNHVLALSKLLQSSSFKNLRKLTANINYQKGDFMGVVTNHAQHLSNKMIDAFKEFFLKHGRQLDELNLLVASHISFPIFDLFQYVNKDLEKMEIWYLHDREFFSTPEFSKFIEVLSSFEKLKHFAVLLNPASQLEIMDALYVPLMNLYKPSLESLIAFNPMSGIDWIHTTEFLCLNNIQLHLYGDDLIHFSNGKAKDYKIETLTCMTLILCEGEVMVKELFEEALDWIIQICPNLVKLNICIGNIGGVVINEMNEFNFEIGQVQKLINTMPYLKYLELYMKIWEEEPQVFPISNWVDETDGLNGVWLGKFECHRKFYTRNSKFIFHSLEQDKGDHYGYSIKNSKAKKRENIVAVS